MNHSFSLLLYSKFSNNSASVRKKIQNSGVQFEKITGLQELCIDNKKVRETIINNTKIKITIVPCLLIGYSNGTIDKYEGENLHDWIAEIIDKHKKPVDIIPETALIEENTKDIHEKELEVKKQKYETILFNKDLEKDKMLKVPTKNNQKNILDLAKEMEKDRE